MTLREADLSRVRLSEVMTRGPATVGESAPLADAAAEMAAGGFRHVPVVDGEDRLVGIVSERDLRTRLGTEAREFADAASDVLSQPVSDVMTPDPIALGPRATLAEALAVFMDDRVGAIPVVAEDERVVGIVSYVDLLRTIRSLSEAARAAAARAAARPQAPSARRASRGACHAGH